ncbi:Lnb N-terminal periplasmic domain-containing protein [Tritonibacter aquimaris]|uniref:Lnb N-terminal periplasmic domain-containing protein n=1 Tax=Tritonibacter aquimaris TaxID=2663379 RepID=UPI002E269458
MRDFDWQNTITATERWITQDYDLEQLESVDMLTSVWGNPYIAHLLVSFGFADGKRVVFSVEIRREEGERFSEIGGFFRQLELVLIAATERDTVKLRTDYCGEEVRMLPVNLTADQRRAMFMSYVGLAQDLERKPQFCNTITANCTTVVYGVARNQKSDLPLRQSLILSGRLPQYLEDLGVLGGEGTLQKCHEAALLPGPSKRKQSDLLYSQAIRTR